MTPTELAIIERALGECSCTSEEAEQASEALGKLRQRDWAVRVLDAWADLRGVQTPVMPVHAGRGFAPGSYECRTGKDTWHMGAAPGRDAARHAAALAVFPTLPADVRLELGECP